MEVISTNTGYPALTSSTQPLSPGVVEALAIGNLPDVQWKTHDDLCDCTYQRIGMWTNPYIAETLEIRLCCMWVKLAEQFPDLVRTIPAFWNYNKDEWVTEPQDWNGQDPMPRAIWYRQLARRQSRPLAEIRAEYADRQPPGAYEPRLLFIPENGGWILRDYARR